MEKITTERCQYNKVTKSLYISSEYFGGGFPNEILVKSHHTGREVLFVYDEEEAIAAEFWDGEMCMYKPKTALPNVKSLTVCHEF